MLSESVLVLLVGNGTLAKEEVVAAIEDLIELKREIAGTRESVAVSLESIGLLRAAALSISASSRASKAIMDPTAD